MKPSWLPRPIFAMPLLALLTVLVVDATQLVRPSLLSAGACAVSLLQAVPDAQAIVEAHRDTIVEHSANNDLPPELVAAVIVDHQVYMTRFRRFTDCAGSAFGANLSLGLAQLRISTAAELDGTYLENLSPAQFRELRSNLLNPELNIAYEARELRDLLQREIRYPGMSADELIHDPAAMALIITEYRMGRLKTARDSSRLAAEAFSALRLIEDGSLDIFGRTPADSRSIRLKVRDYLNGIYCESGIFNESVCLDWQEALGTSGPPR